MNPSVPANGRLVVKATWGALKSGGGGCADLDLQAIAYLDNGCVADAVYWDQPRSGDAAIVHTSGDEGARSGCGGSGPRPAAVLAEEMVVDLRRVAPNVAAIAFTLSSFDTTVPLDTVTDVIINMEHQPGYGDDGGAAAMADPTGASYHRTAFPEFGPGVVVGCIGALLRMGKSTFDVAETEKGLAAAGTFVDAVPMVRQELRLPAPPAGADVFRLPIRLTKGESAEVAVAKKDNTSGVVVAGCSWDLENRGSEGVDIDLCAVLLSKTASVLHCVHWGQLEACNAVWHSGDKTSGEGQLGEDKEQIRVDLGRLPREVESVCFVVNSYDSPPGNGENLGAVGDIYFRLSEGSQDELLRVEGVGAGHGPENNGLALAVLTRTGASSSSAWRLHATSAPVDGDSLLSPTVSEKISAVVRGCCSPSPSTSLSGSVCSPPRNVRAAFAQPWHRHAQLRKASAAAPTAKPAARTAASAQRADKKPSVPATAIFVLFVAVALYWLFGSSSHR